MAELCSRPDRRRCRPPLALAVLAALLVTLAPSPQARADDPLVAFEPRLGDGYDDYPINGETVDDQYRSFLRHSGVLMISYAAARVAAEAVDWSSGTGARLGLGDMSESNGAIPGTSVGSPGHPVGTHTNGLDIDVAYYQQNGADNHLRQVCPYRIASVDQGHCIGAPDNFDAPRTALFVAALASTGAVRVIGVDGQIRPLLDAALDDLCTGGVSDACGPVPLASETSDQGLGWYLYHHFKMHISFKASVDTVAPTVALTSPPADAVYDQGELVIADYGCADDIGGSGIASCSGLVALGEGIDTSTPGPHQFAATAVDRTRNTATVTHSYTVIPEPGVFASALCALALLGWLRGRTPR